jgi:hypothetical protein
MASPVCAASARTCRPTWRFDLTSRLSKQSPHQPELVPDELHELRFKLLSWWQEHGRQTIPWKLKPDGSLPAPAEQLDPYAIWVAEVMRAARQHSQTTQSACSRPDRLCTPGLRAILRFELFP